MIIVPPTPFIRRAKAKVDGRSPAAAAGGAIDRAVTHSEWGDELVVSLSAPLVDKGDVSQMLQASVDGSDWMRRRRSWAGLIRCMSRSRSTATCRRRRCGGWSIQRRGSSPMRRRSRSRTPVRSGTIEREVVIGD